MDKIPAFIKAKERPLNIAHRGASAYLPENTIEAFALAFDKFKADMIEFDIHSAKDGIPVVIHDARLERTTGGRGYVSDYSLAELKKLDAGFCFSPSNDFRFPFRNKGLCIPAFEEVLSGFPDFFLAVEIKEKHPFLLHQVAALIQKYRAQERCIVGSKHDTISREMRARYSPMLRFLSQKEVIRAYFDFKTGKRNLEKDPSAVASMPFQNCGIRFDDKAFIDYLHERRIPSFFWTVNEPELMQALCLKKADGIITNDPGRFTELIARKSGAGPKDA